MSRNNYSFCDYSILVAIFVSFLMLYVYSLPVNASDRYYDNVLDIDVGQSEVIKNENVSRIALGSGKFVSVKILQDSGQLLLIGKKPGITDLRVWKNDKSQKHYLLRVTDKGAEIQLEQLQKYVEGINGIEINKVGSQFIINGSDLNDTDIDKIDVITSEFNNVSNYVNTDNVTPSGMIHMDVKVVEVKKSELKRIGINWSDVINGPEYAVMNDYNTNSFFRPEAGFETGNSTSLPNNIGSHNPYFGISTNLTSVVNLMANDGIARLLAEPQLSCRSGGKAEFLAGGEVPLPVRDKDGSASVTFKQYGIILKIEPTSDQEGYISTHVSVEISTVDDSLKVMDIPGFLTRKTETDMNVKEGETMVISGLVNTDSAKAVDKLPGLGNIPILGELFKSRSFRRNETEMIILVTPHIIDPAHKINQSWIKRAEHINSHSTTELGFKLLD